MSFHRSVISALNTHLTRALRAHPLPPQAGGEGYQEPLIFQRAEPVGIAGLDRKRDRLAREQRRRHRFRASRIGDAPAEWRRVERYAEAHVARGGDRRAHAQFRRKGACHGVCAMVAAEERHHRRAVLRHRHDRRLLGLVGQERRHRADENPGGAGARAG